MNDISSSKAAEALQCPAARQVGQVMHSTPGGSGDLQAWWWWWGVWAEGGRGAGAKPPQPDFTRSAHPHQTQIAQCLPTMDQ
jgi:hypothetical protein